MWLLLSIHLLLFPSDDGMKIKDAWTRPSSEKMATALYFILDNSTELTDTLFQVDSDISEKIEIHETYTQDNMMGMRKINMIVIDGNSSFELKPGGYHIMVMKLKKDINEGDQINFILHFKRAGEIKIMATAKNSN